MTKLWELSNEIQSLEERFAEIQESDATELEKEKLLNEAFDQWIATGAEFDEKACSVARYIKYLEALTEARKEEYRRIRALAEQSAKQTEQVKSYLVSHLQKLGKKKVEGVDTKLSLRKKPAKVILDSEVCDLPGQFIKVEVTPRLAELKKHVQANPDCSFAHLSTIEEYSLLIK
jgi:chromosome segregation ATPase